MSYYPSDDLHGRPKLAVNLAAAVCSVLRLKGECGLNQGWPCARRAEGGQTNPLHFLAPYLPLPNPPGT